MPDRQISIAFQTDKTPADYIALAQLVDSFDFDVVSVYCDAPFQPSFGPLLLMAPHLRRAHLGPAAVSPARIHPIDMAAETALLDQIAPGRIYLGIARGAWLDDHGIHEPDRPIQAIRDAVGIVRYLLAGSESGYPGEVYALAPHVRAPYRLPSQAVPIMIGTWGRMLCALAGELADEVKVGGSANPDFVPMVRRWIHEGEQLARRTSGSVGVAFGAVSVVDDDREAARAHARRAVALYLPVVGPLDKSLTVDPELITRLRHHANYHEWDSAAALISDDLLDRFAFSGDAHDLIRQAEALFAAGATRIEFGTPHGLVSERGIRLLGEKVIPALKGV
jgi:5,10-methylenetetrahydromethanopterin reductase